MLGVICQPVKAGLKNDLTKCRYADILAFSVSHDTENDVIFYGAKDKTA